MLKLVLLSIALANVETVSKQWMSILEDHLSPWRPSGISEGLINRTLEHHGSNVIFQNINGTIYVYDPRGYCFCNNSVYGKSSIFTAHLRVCRALESILTEVVRSDPRFPEFELVWSLDDIPMWVIDHPINSTTGKFKGELYPGFGAVRCWSKGGLALPFLGSHSSWHINTYESQLPTGSRSSLDKREPKVVFRGGLRGCSFEKNTLLDFEYASAFNWTRRDCGRFLLMEMANRYPQFINYTFQHMSYYEQSRVFKYVLSVEGFGGWADRLLHLFFGDMVVFSQIHPCDQWFEPLLTPYYHYIPVAHDFRDLLGTVAWANAHPNAVESILRNGNRFAEKYLRREGMLSYVSTLLKLYSGLLDYKVKTRIGAISGDLLYSNSVLSRICNRNL